MPQNRSGSKLGGKLLQARREAGLTQEQLAEKAGCSTRTVWRSEAGQGQLDHFLRLAELAGGEIAGRSLPAGDCIGTRLLELRRRKGLSRRRVAAISGTSASTLAAIEAGNGGHLACVERVGESLGAALTLVAVGGGAFYSHAATSSAWDAWASPRDILQRLYMVVGSDFDLDPCSPGRRLSRVDAKRHYDADQDGLAQPWHGLVYMNPPYGRGIGRWINKARDEVEAGRAATVFGLIPARTDTGWWHSGVAGHADVWLLRGRLSFGEGNKSAPFASAVVVWGFSAEHRVRMAAAFPDAWQPAFSRVASNGQG